MTASTISGDTDTTPRSYDEYDKYYEAQIAHRRPLTIG